MARWLQLGGAAASKDDHWDMLNLGEADQPARVVARRTMEATAAGRELAVLLK